jgi:hypothetical protein
MHGIAGVIAGATCPAARSGTWLTARRIHPASLTTSQLPPHDRQARAAVDGSYFPSFLRCTRVRRSSLRCFFFDIRLRRFLITEPITPLSVWRPESAMADRVQ